MKRPMNYRTKQREAIYDYIVSLEGSHVTASQISAYFEKKKMPVGRTTVYRFLDQLTESGKVRRYTTDGVSGACYQYVDGKSSCHEHLHLKCESCGALLHLECDAVNELWHHLFQEHTFQMNILKTVLYGTCTNCMEKT